MPDPAIELRGITKRFPGVVANEGISLSITRGEIHAIVGENGAGKSTLMNILYGLYHPDEGEIFVGGRPARIDGPRRALALGIGMVHQHFMLVRPFTVWENIVLGFEGAAVLPREEAERRIEALCAQYGFHLDAAATAETLSVGEQQRIEILKVLYRGAEILILDEPTAVLTPQEVDALFRNLRRLQEAGKTLVFISHKLDEVLQIADRISVLRRGRMIGTVSARETTRAALAEMMVGRPVVLRLEKPVAKPGDVGLTVENVAISGAGGRDRVAGVTFRIRAGEIYAIAGVEGNGQSELVEGIIGLRPLRAGRVHLGEDDITAADVMRSRLAGLAHVPEDRQRRGLVLAMSVAENLILGHHTRPEFGGGRMVDGAAVSRFARERVRDYDIRLVDVDGPALALSGGNQQKVVLAREMAFAPRVLVAAQPTRGLDVGAIEFVYQEILEARAGGMAVLLVSADLEEVFALADRIGVLYKGRLVAEFSAAETSPADVGMAMLGGAPAEAAPSGGAGPAA